MPPPVRRKTLVLVLALGAALAFVAVAYAGNGGFAPETPHSPNASRINDSYKWIAIFAALILVLVEGSLLWFIFRYRRRGRPRTAEGPQIHAHTRLELIWTLIPVLILAAIASFLFYELPGIKNVPAAKAEGGPLRITSHDVDHSWWIPELGGKFDAIPGQRTQTWFKANQLGSYRGRCGEFCGVFHAEMRAFVISESKQEYASWVGRLAGQALGRGEWEGVCAKCHGLQGQGGYGPAIAGSALLTQAQSLRQLLLNGQNRIKPIGNYMPPVARGWNDRQFQALFAYVKQNVYKKATSGG